MALSASASIFAITLVSVSQLLPCKARPKRDYGKFAKHAAETKCKSLYADFDRQSQARLDAHLDAVVGLALTAFDHAHPKATTAGDGGQPAPSSSAADGGLPSTAPGEEEANEQGPGDDESTSEEPGDEEQDKNHDGDDEEDDEEEEEPKPPPDLRTPQQKSIDKLRKLSGRDLFVALCRKKMPNLPTLYRRSGPDDFIPLKVAAAKHKGGKAELRAKAKKKSKKDKGKDKSKDKGKEAPEHAPPPDRVRMIKERGRFRVMLEPISLTWQHRPDGRLHALFDSPILSLGVETDGRRSPTYAYNKLVQHLRDRECDAFYELLDQSSRDRIERMLPMMIGFASAIGKDTGRKAKTPSGSKELVVAMCNRASPNELRSSGVHLGEVHKEEVVGNRATLTIRRPDQDGAEHDVMMIREQGDWHMSIDTFAAFGVEEPEEDADKEGEDKEADGADEEDDAWPAFTD